MSVPGEWLRRIHYLFNRRRLADELRDEMQAHREMLAAPRLFGNTLRLREEAADVWGWRRLDEGAQDARYAARSLLLNHRAYGATALVMLVLGIGSTTAVFTVVSGLFLKPLPFAEPGRLVQAHGTRTPTNMSPRVWHYDVYRSENRAFDGLAAYEVGARYLRADTETERVLSVRTEGSFFDVLGVPAILGRTYTSAEDDRGSVVVSALFWQRRLGGAPNVVGQTLTLDGQVVAIVGVMPEWFQFPYRSGSLLAGVAENARTDIWMPFEKGVRLTRPDNVIGRLRSGVSLPAAQEELNAIARRVESAVPAGGRSAGVTLVPLAREVVPPETRSLMLVLFASVAIVLALACANVANLSLARMAARRREVGVRAAIGASPWRLARQFLVESLLLTGVAGAGGLLLAWWLVREVAAAAAPLLPRAHEIAVDWRVVAFVLGVCAVAGIVLAAAPALLAARRDAPSVLLQDGSSATMSPAQRRVRHALVVAEVALAFVLGVGAALLLRELARLRATDAGLVPANVLTFHVGQRRISSDVAARFAETADRVAALPGVQAAGFSQLLPLQNWGWTSNSSDFRVRGRAPRAEEFPIELRFVTPGYFEALGIRLRRGRLFSRDDRPGTPTVLVINEALARRAFAGEDPIGLTTTRGTIIGVIADVRQATLDRPAVPEIYTVLAQNWSQVAELGMTLAVRTRGRPEGLVEPIRAEIHRLNPAEAVFGVKTMDRVVADSLSTVTLTLTILSAFAVLAIVLALSGTYGVIAYVASSRTREFAIRLALGAGRGRVVRGILGQGLALTGAGLALGAGGAAALGRLTALAPVSMRPPDAATMVPIAVLIAAAAIAAALVPARRAARVDPASALRLE